MASSFLGGDGLEVGEIEAQALRVHQGAGLLDVVAQMPPQDRLEEMGGGVVPAMMRRRRAASTARWAGSLTWTVPASTFPWWTMRSLGSFWVSVTRMRQPSPVMTPVSPTWPPDSP